ncbi:hypothetical protein JZ751_002283 [Albula glossodonta]|uniref:Uncharacterized protein n=1 Tax=Albula glossodonta TaxID=121402 RepID=A0A8T2PI94_9TELE|nr:hypothetical protein JZ751_002283 [Albula glossodonta]
MELVECRQLTSGEQWRHTITESSVLSSPPFSLENLPFCQNRKGDGTVPVSTIVHSTLHTCDSRLGGWGRQEAKTGSKVHLMNGRHRQTGDPSQ